MRTIMVGTHYIMSDLGAGCRDNVISTLESLCAKENDLIRRIDLMLDFFDHSGRHFPAYCLQLMQRSRELSHQAEYPIGEAKSFCNTGLLLLERSDIIASRMRLREALEIYRNLADRTGQIQCLTGLGSCACQNGEFEDALDQYRQGLDLARLESNTQAYATVITGLARCHIDRGDHLRALSCLDHLNPEEISDPLIRAKYHLNRATAFRKLALADEADVCIGLADRVEGIQADFVVQIRLEQARILHLRQRLDDALRLLESALARVRRTGDLIRQADCLLALGQLKVDLGEGAAVREAYYEAVEILKNWGNPLLEASLQQAIAALEQSDSAERKPS